MEKIKGRVDAKAGSWSWCLEKEKQQYETQDGLVEKLAREPVGINSDTGI